MIRAALAAAFLLMTAFPAEARPDPALQAVLATFERDEHPDLRGAIVLRDGQVVAEHYYNGETADSLHDIRSAGKSVTALLVGIAIDRGKIHGVDDAVGRYLPELTGSAIGDVALRDVLTMRSGLAAFDEDPASPGNEDKMDLAPDPIAFVRTVPRADPPGTRYRYNSLTAWVAGAVVARATGGTMANFAGAHLFRPLGITHWQWSSDSAGYTKGQGNLSLRLRDVAAIGDMVRQDGRYHGRRVISAGWIAAMLAPKQRIADSDPYADGYGYFWYDRVQHIAGTAVPVVFASGNGGNKIYVVPSRHMVVAITSSAYGKGYGQRRSQAILQAILAADLKP
ncbi:serine hydrolase domain-containing protein [Sphingomonas sp. ASY06-1R]|uniref:serine hydrolase domain-containing protein n=1 Tax=Sphingomonas sp. ASY06-1R TaxID=3445771 RepID=UPI003FA326C7